jgi:hypothetical protein
MKISARLRMTSDGLKLAVSEDLNFVLTHFRLIRFALATD